MCLSDNLNITRIVEIFFLVDAVRRWLNIRSILGGGGGGGAHCVYRVCVHYMDDPI